jgi:RHS repeat-associated protein
LTNGAGASQATYIYEPFGNTTQAGTASNNTFQYTGRENDFTGVYAFRKRYYSPRLQRFLGEDPLGFGGGEMNFYTYTGNNPINATDPLGLAFGDYWDIRATIGFYDSVASSDSYSGYTRAAAGAASFALNMFGMQNAQDAGMFAGQGNWRCGVSKTVLSVFQGMTLASPLLFRNAFSTPPGPALIGEARAFSTVSRNFWASRGGADHLGTSWALHHWWIAQRLGVVNSNWNLVAIPSALNSYMNGAASTLWLQHAIATAIPASLAGGGGLGAWAGFQSCKCK